jgi:hypothetical protein
MLGDELTPGDALAPGDEAPPDEPSSGENVCPTCEGSGEADGGPCEACGGTGIVNEAVGGG